MLDFVDTGELGVLVNEQSVAHKEALIGKSGVMRGAELALTFSSLRANDLIWPYVVNSYLKGKAPPAFDLLYWNSDATNLPGPMYCWYVRNTYLDNRICLPGETIQCGEPLDLWAGSTCPCICTPRAKTTSCPGRRPTRARHLLSGETTFVLGASGHVAGVINPASKNKRNHWVGGGPDRRKTPTRGWPAATRVDGSWWTNWAGLAGQAQRPDGRAARTDVGP